MSRRSHKNYRRLQGLRAVETLPADGTGSPPLLAPRWPLVPVLPTPVVNDQRWCVGASYDVAVEYFGRSVVRLDTTGVDSAIVENASLDVASENWSIRIVFKDEIAGFNTTTRLVENGEYIGYNKSWFVQIQGSSDVWMYLCNSDTTFFGGVGISVDVLDAEWHTIDIINSGDSIHFEIDGVVSASISTIGWTPESNQNIVISGGATIIPLQVCNITQSLNGTLIDNIPCDESTGTELRNTVSQDRPATLSDANAHALAWVPQPSKQYGVWVWRGVFRNAGTDWVDCGRPTWLNQLRPSVDEFTIVSKINKSGTDWGRVICLGPTSGSFDQFAVVCSGSDTQNQINAISGGMGSWSNPSLPTLIGSTVVVVSAFGLSETKTYLNGAQVGLSTTGSYINGTDVVFIGSATGGGDNFEGDICCVEIYAGANADGSITGLTLIDRYDFDKWNGTGSGVSQNGFPFTVSDGAPFTAKSYAWIPA